MVRRISWDDLVPYVAVIVTFFLMLLNLWLYVRTGEVINAVAALIIAVFLGWDIGLIVADFQDTRQFSKAIEEMTKAPKEMMEKNDEEGR